ncbi:MAG: aminodeoxychorismate synthase, component I [Candidatus Dactylopiibacterium carminicum]|uniref:aminodeoxychorismate synthase component I n=1 Tax=Candidatus Dactylopiibacterium carminicum TaxID=857335 RepID=UPI000BC96F16|nr:aminodeoxychorismate synthase component I [Candidatus Dactylopiibacterium carminicum]PAS98524.1 MAG: aminodeoxychorismate synthase, component I [Candidatus Dactylopiibacterium carminicum]
MRASTAFALFEDNVAQPAHARWLHNCIGHLRADHPEQLPACFATLDAARAQGHWVALAAHYELGLAFEPVLQPNLGADQPLLRAWIFTEASSLAGDALESWWQTRLDALSPQAREGGLLTLYPTWDESRHASACHRILDWIKAGDCYQVNLTFPLHGRHYGHPLAVAHALRATQGSAHGALIHDGQDWILSRSPELFITRCGERLKARPMKGTAARSPDPVEDAARAQALATSPKDQAENLMIVDLIRNDLGRLTAPGGVEVTSLFSVERYASVYQLTSSIEAAPVRAGLEETLRALFPCGSVTGAPKIRAMQIIDTLEGAPRGIYCGGLGWIAPDGDFSLNVPIRTLLLTQQGNCRLDVGSGIVADSNPTDEYRECLTKARFAMPDLHLIETLRREADGCYPLLAGHLARLAASAAKLGFICPQPAIRAALMQEPAEGLLRVRLQLWRDGRFVITSRPLDPQPVQPRITPAGFTLDSTDPRLHHKTSARRFYDEALQQALEAGLYDVLFCNEHGALCEGARSNLFLSIDDGPLLTPASDAGLLPGVLRADLLARGLAREAMLTPADLVRARHIYMGNALRGLVKVTLV